METFDADSFAFSSKKGLFNLKKPTFAEKKHTADSFCKVMPLHQIIRFANQAAERGESVWITVEQQVDRKKFLRSALKGHFRTAVNQNRQIAFESSNKKILFLLPIENILSIELAVS